MLMFALVLFDVAKGGENLRELRLEINYQLEIYLRHTCQKIGGVRVV